MTTLAGSSTAWHSSQVASRPARQLGQGFFRQPAAVVCAYVARCQRALKILHDGGKSLHWLKTQSVVQLAPGQVSLACQTLSTLLSCSLISESQPSSPHLRPRQAKPLPALALRVASGPPQDWRLLSPLTSDAFLIPALPVWWSCPPGSRTRHCPS